MDPKTVAAALRGPPSPMSDALFSSAPQIRRVTVVKTGQPMRSIKLIRHGATALNNDDVSVDRIRGWKDIPLSSEGCEEAERLGQKIKDDPPKSLVSSDLKRAHETAKIISDEADVPLVDVTQKFRPWNVGELSGEKSSKAVPILADYAENSPDKKLAGGESFNDFKGRFFDGLHGALDKYDGMVGIVTHHRGERLIHAWLKAGAPENGDIDIGTFNKKGEATGSADNLSIPMDKLRAVVGSTNDQ